MYERDTQPRDISTMIKGCREGISLPMLASQWKWKKLVDLNS
jgi:hypothetical protein